jgi:hypothetical protein
MPCWLRIVRNHVNFYVYLDSNDVRWNLRADDLTQQSDECLTFLVVSLEPDDQ